MPLVISLGANTHKHTHMRRNIHTSNFIKPGIHQPDAWRMPGLIIWFEEFTFSFNVAM